MSTVPTRDQALALLHEYTQNPNLRKHAYAVEAAMRHYAPKFGEDEQLWALAGLLHDFDYERFPEPPDHVTRGSEILRERGFPAEVIEAIQGHAPWTGVPRARHMAKALFACDELSGFLVAMALVRPNKKLDEVKVESVIKKLKDKSFARKVNRDDITIGAAELDLPLEEHIAHVLEAMRGIAETLGL